MTITKIEDLGKVSLSPFDYYYRCEEVKELVDHLQSEIIKWRNDMPGWGKVILLVDLENEWQEVCYANKNRDCIISLHGEARIKFERLSCMKWCYMDDLLKTIGE